MVCISGCTNSKITVSDVYSDESSSANDFTSEEGNLSDEPSVSSEILVNSSKTQSSALPNKNSSTQANSNNNTTNKYSPELVMGSTYSEWNQISEKSFYKDWTYVRENVNGWLHHMNRIGHPASSVRYSNKDFNGIIDIMKENKIKMYIESKSYYVEDKLGTDFQNIGYHDAIHTMNYIKRIYDAGYKVHAMNFDGAYCDYKKAGLNDADARKNVVTYFKTIHDTYPDIELYFLFNFPNWGWKGQFAYRTDIPGNSMYLGDAYEVYKSCIPDIKAAGILIAGVAVDNPYEYAVGSKQLVGWEMTGIDIKNTDWIGRILELEQMVHTDKMKFSLIFNSQDGGEKGGSLYTTNTEKFIKAYMSRGGRPDVCIMESWYENPKKWLPENDLNTMSGSVKKAIESIKGYK